MVPFQVERLNIGGAMNLSKGIFAVRFTLFYVLFQLNGINTGKVNNHFNINGSVFSMDHFTNFSGWLVEEDLVLSIV